MKKKNKTGVLITLITLIVICLFCGIIGFLESKKDTTNKKPNTNKDYKVAYKYYIDGEEVKEMVENDFTEIENKDFEGQIDKIPNYKFEKYACTNNVIGEWDEENWKFNPDLTANTTCRLYFIKTLHTVTIKANNGKLPNNESEEKVIVQINDEEKINILPNDGFKYEKVECNNDVIANYDETTKDLTISNISKDAICTISYQISDYVVEVNTSNGTVSESKKNTNYGGTVTFDVTPSENYKFDRVSCTNNQNNANYSNGKLTITGITDDTICTIEFKPIKYEVSLEVINGNLLSSSPSTQSVAEGRTVSFGITPNEGYQITGADASCDNLNGAKLEISSGTLFVYNVTSNMQCKITLKATNN